MFKLIELSYTPTKYIFTQAACYPSNNNTSTESIFMHACIISTDDDSWKIIRLNNPVDGIGRIDNTVNQNMTAGLAYNKTQNCVVLQLGNQLYTNGIIYTCALYV